MIRDIVDSQLPAVVASRGARAGIFPLPPSIGGSTPTSKPPSTIRRKNSKNQPFSANFRIFCPSMPPNLLLPLASWSLPLVQAGK